MVLNIFVNLLRTCSLEVFAPLEGGPDAGGINWLWLFVSDDWGLLLTKVMYSVLIEN